MSIAEKKIVYSRDEEGFIHVHTSLGQHTHTCVNQSKEK